MTPFETIYTDEMVVACNGGGGPLGHPRVYLNLGPAGEIECPYCSRQFLRRTGPSGGADDAVATLSARGPGAAREEESPPPRQTPS